MKDIYKYENGVVCIKIAETSYNILREKTPVFLKNVVKERSKKCIQTK